LVDGLPNEAYHGDDWQGRPFGDDTNGTLSSTQLKLLDRSPAHFKAGGGDFDSASMAKGRAFHALMETTIAGTRTFRDGYVIEPADKIDKRTKEGKEQWAAFCRQARGREILAKQDWNDIHLMVDSVLAIPEIGELLRCPSFKEVSAYWQETVCGQPVSMRSRPDWWSVDMEMVIDYKGTRDASQESFRWDIRKFRYDLSAAHYIAGTKAKEFGWLAVEFNPPYCAMLYVVSAGELVKQALRRAELLEKLVKCRSENRWPGYDWQGGAIQKIKLV
jgi:hypothetical protein